MRHTIRSLWKYVNLCIYLSPLSSAPSPRTIKIHIILTQTPIPCSSFVKIKPGVTRAMCLCCDSLNHSASIYESRTFEVNRCLMIMTNLSTHLQKMFNKSLHISQNPSVHQSPQCWDEQHKYHICVAVTRLELCCCEQYVGGGAVCQLY